ncbi:MAG: glutathione peroxidase [Rhizomicrobium sp.]
MPNVFDFSAKSITGKDVALADYRGQVLLVVNTASKCGFTPQYEGLQRLYHDLHPRGFSVLGFPCNQFGQQEPGTETQIGEFCATIYGADFPMFAKVEVNGESAHPLYRFLKHEKPGVFGLEGIKWNFTKFLIDREGAVVSRFAPTAKPEGLRAPIEALL